MSKHWLLARRLFQLTAQVGHLKSSTVVAMADSYLLVTQLHLPRRSWLLCFHHCPLKHSNLQQNASDWNALQMSICEP